MPKVRSFSQAGLKQASHHKSHASVDNINANCHDKATHDDNHGCFAQLLTGGPSDLIHLFTNVFNEFFDAFNHSKLSNEVIKLFARAAGIEPATYGFGDRHSTS